MASVKKRIPLQTVMAIILAFVLAACILAPVSALAEDGLTQNDFEEARKKPGIVTAKGITYYRDRDYFSYYTFEPERTYRLAEDIVIDNSVIDIRNEGEYVFDLNGKLLNRTGGMSGFFFFSKGKLRITGNGTIGNEPGPSVLTLKDCDAVIDSGTFNGFVSCSSTSGSTTITINDAYFAGSLWVTGEGTKGVVNNGTFYGSMNPAVTVSDGASLTVNNGTFTSGDAGLVANRDTADSDSGKPARSVVINGGTFQNTIDAQTGFSELIGGLFLDSCDETVLNGGTFRAEGYALGAIVATVDPERPYDAFERFLGEGHKYSKALRLQRYESDETVLFATQKNLSVKKAPVRDISDAVVKLRDQTYTGKALKPKPTVVLNGTTLVRNTDYTVSYRNNTDAGTAKAVIKGIGDYQGTAVGTFRIKPLKITPKVTLSKKSYTYDGKVKHPAVTVKYKGKKLAASDYSVSYSKGCRNAGNYTASVKMKGNYSGTGDASFRITKAENKITNVKARYFLTLAYSKKAQKVITLAPKAKGSAKIGFRLSSIKKDSEKISSGFTVTSKGVVKTAEKLPKGTYTVKVKITAAKTKNYKAQTKTVALTVDIE